MANNSDIHLRNLVFYSIFVRNHTQEGSFEAIVADLDRIRALGVNVVWLLPIHPIGKEKRKGSLGSPYAIADYRSINPEYGTLEDFVHLTEEIHKRDMRCIIDVVYNHTSPDSLLFQAHPEYFFRFPDGSFGNRFGEWSDVIDLDFSHPELCDYLIETLSQWAQYVDGFRCDVASAVPISFWTQARRHLEAIHPGLLWLAESVHTDFVKHGRELGYAVSSDSELYEAFDITYDYDIWHFFERFMEGKMSLETYLSCLLQQESVYPANYSKLRMLENHDQPRLRSRVHTAAQAEVFTAFSYFEKGPVLLYAGQEIQADHRPDLFESDKIDWNYRHDMSPLLKRLASIKCLSILAEGAYDLASDSQSRTILVSYLQNGRRLVGVFPLDAVPCQVILPFFSRKSACPVDLLYDDTLSIRDGVLSCSGKASIFYL